MYDFLIVKETPDISEISIDSIEIINKNTHLFFKNKKVGTYYISEIFIYENKLVYINDINNTAIEYSANKYLIEKYIKTIFELNDYGL